LTSNGQSFELVKEYFGLLEGVISVKGSQYQEFVTVEAPVAIWEKVLETVFFSVGMKNGGKLDENKITSKNNRMAVRTLQYKLPKVLRGHVSTVLNTVQAPLFKKDKKVKNFESLKNDIINRVKENSEKKEKVITADKIRENNRDEEVTISESSKTFTVVSKKGKRDYFLGLTYPNLLNDVYNIKSNIGETLDFRF
jgi:hypothetical protein